MSKTHRPAHAPSHPIHAPSRRDMPLHVRLPTYKIYKTYWTYKIYIPSHFTKISYI